MERNEFFEKKLKKKIFRKKMKILQKIAKKRQKTNFLIFFVRILNKAVGRIFASISKLFQF